MDIDILDLSFLNQIPPQPLLPNKGVVKYLIKPGEMAPNQKLPQKGCKAYIKLEGRRIDGSALDAMKNANEIRKISLFSDDYIEGIHIAVSSMMKNEIAWFKIEAKYHFFKSAYPNHEDQGGNINDKDPLLYKIELLDYKSNILETMDFEGRIERFEESREKGKELFSKGKFEEAYEMYMKSVHLLRNFPNSLKDILNESQKNQVKNFSNIMYSNVSLCKIKLKAWFDALKLCEEGLKTTPNDIKLLYRKGQCLMGVHEFEPAIEVFSKVLELDPENNEAGAQLKTIEEMKKTEKIREKKKYEEIFKNLSNEEKKEALEKKKKEYLSEKKEENSHENSRENSAKKKKEKRITIDDLEKGIIIDANDPKNVLNEQTHEFNEEE